MMTIKVYRIEMEDKGDSIDLNPRVPKFTANGEDDITDRICAAPTIVGCVHAILLPYGINDKDMFEYYYYLNILKQEYPLYLYESDVPYHLIHQPTEEEVPDVFITGELWITGACKFTKSGKYYLGWMEDIGENISKYYMRHEDHDKPMNMDTDRILIHNSKSFTFLRYNIYTKDLMIKEIEKRYLNKNKKEGE